MKISVVSHTPIDHIQSNEVNTVTVGGPTCYGGLTIKSLSHEVNLVTKVGRDFDYRDMLNEKGLIISDSCISDMPTTRFRIVIEGQKRKLFLLARCADITVHDVNMESDGCIISPIINEINSDVIDKISKMTNFVFVDPQGFIRKVGEDEMCYLDKPSIDLSNTRIDAIKVDREEAFALTGLRGTDALYKLRTKTAMLTLGNRTLMLHDQKIYEIDYDVVNVTDSTGAGDIFAGAYTTAFLESKDAQWALCYGVASAVTALRSGRKGIEKIPCKRDVDEYASVLHNGIKTLTV